MRARKSARRRDIRDWPAPLPVPGSRPRDAGPMSPYGGCRETDWGWPLAAPPAPAPPGPRASDRHCRRSPLPPGTGRRARWRRLLPGPARTRPRRPGAGRPVGAVHRSRLDEDGGTHVVAAIHVGGQLGQQIGAGRECARSGNPRNDGADRRSGSPALGSAPGQGQPVVSSRMASAPPWPVLDFPPRHATA